MIGYATLGTRDLAAAARFYDALLAPMGAARMMETPRMVVWSIGRDKPSLGVCLPFDGGEASVGNGGMIALAARDRAQVDAIHAAALALGGRDEGAPGERFPGFYAGYFRDPDGNKLNIFHWA